MDLDVVNHKKSHKKNHKKNKHEPNSLEEWSQLLCNEEMLIFSNTALGIHDILNNDKKGAMELASVILRDPSLTVKLLKISNSITYNPSQHKIVTVSRSIILIGFEVIRELTIACSFFEPISSSPNRQRINEEIALAIHAAVHAKYIAIAMRDPSPEEVFIATLLRCLGSICFWCFCSEQGELIQLMLNSGNCSKEEAERQILGFELKELGCYLSDAWKLSGLIEESIKLSPHMLLKNPRLGFVQLGYDIVEALKDGLESKKHKDCINNLMMLTKQSRLDINESIKKSTNIAFDIACQLGVPDAAILIKRDSEQDDALVESLIVDKKQLQVSIAQDITSIISGQPDVNLLLETVVEGVHRVIGMDRTIFSMLVADKSSLRERLSLGWRKRELEHKVIFNITETQLNIFSHAFSGSQAFWAKPSVNAKLYTRMAIEVVGKNECFMMPIFSKNKPIGLIYADREVSRQSLTEEDFNTFKYFAQQANIGFAIYQMQRNL